MLIRLVDDRTIRINRINYPGGSELELQTAQALELIESGYATCLEEVDVPALIEEAKVDLPGKHHIGRQRAFKALTQLGVKINLRLKLDDAYALLVAEYHKDNQRVKEVVNGILDPQ